MEKWRDGGIARWRDGDKLSERVRGGLEICTSTAWPGGDGKLLSEGFPSPPLPWKLSRAEYVLQLYYVLHHKAQLS